MTQAFKLALRIGRFEPIRRGPITQSSVSYLQRLHSLTAVFMAAFLVALATSCGDKKPNASYIATALMLYPGDNVQAKVAAAGSGATLTFQPGVYRMQTITPLTGQQFVGQPGAVLSGARLLTNWTADGTTWHVSGQTQQGLTAGQCESGYPRCIYPEDLWIDNVLQTHVASLAAVTTGTWYFDYAGDRIYIGTNPAGHTVETSVTPYAFTGTEQGVGSGVTISGLVIEKYATPAQHAAVGATNTGANWVIRDNEIRGNHGAGVRIGNWVQIVHNNVHHNGQGGVGGKGTMALVENNEIAYNNTAHFDFNWEAGGSKFVRTQNIVVRGNFSHHNRGPGLWWDGNNDGALIEGNRVEDNAADGIFWEISYSATIRNNSLSRNGFGRAGLGGAGILLNSSGAPAGKTIDIYGNTLVGNKQGIIALQADRGSGNLGPWIVQNLSVHDNTIELIAGGYTGIDRYSGDTGIWSSRNNHFDHNTYNLQTAPAAPFIWNQAYQTETQWRALGNDTAGTFNR